MKSKYIQLLKGCIALIITVSSLLFIQATWQNYAVDSPLDKAIKDIDGVRSVTLDDSHKSKDGMIIFVELDNTVNLQKTFKEISTVIESTLKDEAYTLEIKDKRSPELEQIYYDVHHYIQKAIVDGDFPLLNEKVLEKANSAGAEAKVYVDGQNVYLQLSKNDNYLYAVVARQSDKMGGNI